jgi:hypothetical protein
VVSQAAVKVTVMAAAPARSESSHRRTFPLEMSVPPILQPDGSAAMQGSLAADGTAWAARIIEWPVPHAEPMLGHHRADLGQIQARRK